MNELAVLLESIVEGTVASMKAGIQYGHMEVDFKIKNLMKINAELLDALIGMNHIAGDDPGGYCICPKNDGSASDERHSTSCADARKAIRNAEGVQP